MRTLAVASADGPPVVKVIRKNIAKKDERAFKEWQAEAEKLAARVLGDDAYSISRFGRNLDDGADTHRCDVVVTFRDQATHDAWEASPERAAWIASGDALQTRVGVKTASLDDFVAVKVEGEQHPPFLPQYVTIIGGLYPTLVVFQKALIPGVKTLFPALAAAPPSVFLFGTVMLCVATMLKLSVPTSKRVLGFYLKPGGDTPGNTLLVVGGFASLVTGVCVLTGEVDAPALFEAVQAGNFWQWVVRPGGE